MRIHTDKLTSQDIYAAAQRASKGGHGTVILSATTRHNSRKRDHAFEVRLTGDGIVKGNRTMDGEDYAATWDSWGWFLGHLFTLDPDMIAGTDDGADAFHRRTSYAFTGNNLPDEPAPAPAITWADGFGVWHVKVLTDLTRGEAGYFGGHFGRRERDVNIKGVASRALKQELTSRSYGVDPRCYQTPVKVGVEGAYTIFRERVPQYV